MLWDADEGLYLDPAGQQVERDLIQRLMDESLRWSEDRAFLLAQQGTTEREIFNSVSAVIKSEYIRQYSLGLGGLSNMTFSDWGTLGAMLRNEYKYVREFAALAMAGKLTDTQFRYRINQMINSARAAYNRAKGKVAKLLGFDRVSWELLAGANHCDICLERNGQGSRPIGKAGGFPTSEGDAFPGDGSAHCGMNDKCHLKYTNSVTGKEYAL